MSNKAKQKRIPVGFLSLQFAGDMIVPRLPDKAYAGLFRRYESLFASLANMERGQRLIIYKMLAALMLTSYAKKASDSTQKKQLFDLKNELYFNLANDPNARRLLAFKYLKSKSFRVLSFCDPCTKANTESKVERHKWKFCNRCKVDRSFYNVLSMHHRFADGYFTVFLSNDLIPKLQGVKPKFKGKLDGHEEEGRFSRYLYSVRNLDAFDLDSVIAMQKKLLR